MVHCNIFFSNETKKTPKYPSQTLGRIPKNNLLPEIPIIVMMKQGQFQMLDRERYWASQLAPVTVRRL